MPTYSKIPKLVNAINKGVVRAVAGKKGGIKAEVKKKYPKTPKPSGMKGRGTTSTSVANPKSAVKVLPRKSAPKSDLSNRGKKLTRSERSERAQDYEFDKSLDAHYKQSDAYYGGDMYMFKPNLRGPGKANARKAAAIKKEGKSVVKINSQRNLKKKGK